MRPTNGTTRRQVRSALGWPRRRGCIPCLGYRSFPGRSGSKQTDNAPVLVIHEIFCAVRLKPCRFSFLTDAQAPIEAARLRQEPLSNIVSPMMLAQYAIAGASRTRRLNAEVSSAGSTEKPGISEHPTSSGPGWRRRRARQMQHAICMDQERERHAKAEDSSSSGPAVGPR